MSGVDIAGLVSEWQEAMEGVTPGPWSPSRFGMQVLTGDSWATVCTFHDKNGCDGKWNDHRLASWEDGRGASLETSNADWVARCSPSGISALLDALTEATRQRDEALAALKASEERGERLSQELASARCPQETMFPIMGGPKVPWSLIEPYEAQAHTNHGQTLKRLAERGGLSICEAMAVMSSVRYDKRPIAKPNVEDWLDFIAERKAKAVRRARSVLENGPADLADATNNPPSDPGTEQREAGV